MHKAVQLCWKPPVEGWIKLNTDGAWEGRVVECGRVNVIRGSDSEWLGGFAKCLGICSAFVMELWGVFKGLKLTRKIGVYKGGVECGHYCGSSDIEG
ncbi:hypothetical protein TSUD_22910 [Trifolium subterraneum]|uniref:Uncharacterized protein n=1 Tax=Trifolium subterraneum TaxID=3900 RepID=A0A2Z6NPS7_TRISU|nr:hypothetical protein TSUD_22910 [Trifolium subterraneum]